MTTGWVDNRTTQGGYLWVYVIVGLLWAASSDLVYHQLLHHLSLGGIIFAISRTTLVFVIVVWLTQHLIKKINMAETQHGLLLRILPQPLLVHSNDKWVYANPAGFELFGARYPEELIGRSIWEFVPPDEVTSTTEHLQHLYEVQQPSGVYPDRRMVRLDGAVIDVEILAAPLRLNGTSAVQVLITDVTAKKCSERQRVLACSQLKVFIEQSPDAIIFVDSAGCLTLANSKFEELFGVIQTEYIGTPWVESPLVPTELHEEARQIHTRVLEGETITAYRTVRQTSQGRKIDVSLTAFALPGIGIAKIIRDISGELKAEQQLLQSETLAAVGQLAASIAHEIRNPLTVVSGFLDILPSAPIDKQSEYINIVSEELSRMKDIVTDMLYLAKPQTGEFHAVNILEVVSGVAHFLEPEGIMNGAELSMHLPPSTEKCIVSGLENRLKQVLINLIRNALDAIADAPKKTILIDVQCHGENVQITVHDTGIGMTEEQLQRISEPFYTTKDHGTGLGLHVCQQIVSQHHGTLWFESEVGRGTSVKILLPLTRPTP